MNYFDIVILVIVLIAGIRGLKHGLIYELASVVALILGVFLGFKYHSLVSLYFNQHVFDIQSPAINATIGFIIIFIAVQIIILVIAYLVGRVVSLSIFGVFNSILGYIFSVVKSFIFLSFVIYGISKIGFFDNFTKSLERDSTFYPTMVKITLKIAGSSSLLIENLSINPDEAKQKLDMKANDVTNKIDSTIKDITPPKLEDITPSIKQGLEEIKKDI